MEKGLSLENITKGLLAIEKIRGLLGSNLREEGGAAVKQDSLTVAHEILLMLSEFIPAMRGGSFTRALQKSSSYSKAYREIKRHVRDTGGAKADLGKLAKAIKVVAPVLENRQKVYLDKLTRIIDILNS